MTSVCLARLRRELQEIKKKPLENIRASPRENNLLEWHYVIEGPKGSPYEGGFYHGTVVFPKEYPYKPPSIQMFTPSGRFKVSTSSNLTLHVEQSLLIFILPLCSPIRDYAYPSLTSTPSPGTLW